MNTVPKHNLDALADVVSRLRAQLNPILKLYDDAQEAVTKAAQLVTLLNEKIEAFNDTSVEGNETVQEIYDQMEEYIDGCSEGWQNSDMGQAYIEWAREWSHVCADEISQVEFSEYLEIEDLESAIDIFEASLPSTRFEF